MSRRRDALYCGAVGTIAVDRLTTLGSGYVVQPKSDGIYGIVSVDRSGRVSSIVTRSGDVLGPSLMAEFSGLRWVRDSILIAEIELWTEPSNRAAATRGYRMIHVFDAHRVNGRDVSRESYRVRRDAVMRAESELVNFDRDEPWFEDTQGDAHDLKSGRYTTPMPRSWRRIQVVPQSPSRLAETAWQRWVDQQHAGPVEGLVAVALDAPIGARRAKLKAKLTTTIDVVVTHVDATAMTVYWSAANQRLAVHRPSSLVDVAIGSVLEVTHEGFYENGLPRFARVLRTRRDLAV